MQIDVPLINEAQIGSRLNAAIEHNRRGEFALLLSLLSADARDMAQFQWQKELDTAEKLQRQFELPPKQTLVADLSSDNHIIDNSAVFMQQGARAFQLQQALRPEALVIRGGEPIAIAEALSNCEFTTRLRQRGQLPSPQVEIMHFADQLAIQRNLIPRLTSA
ncbi:VC2046/SO_2500 family protein [Shewanella xiamenensis]|uniref:VC2046/SO_2500 family protein n=1 Tax=Shewanella TaxID=22 RepID=UPI0006459F09|nr:MULTISPECIES: VC2046/SO_2500 family protein [Shewanella]MEE1980589.1 VC2046/SO_2500 family protein [Shewanella xiamenensis]NSM24350.1 queD-like protein [Shewanella sp. ZOR0012]QRK77836.1 queD-like protein [Shewanella sp. LZH-2]BDA60799.1 queD-like protein [Shewanella xiamenensis]